MKKLSIFIFFFLISIQLVASELKVYFIDVGKGDDECIILPNGKVALIDGGPSNTKISAFLTAHGITTTDYLVLTHPHEDHYYGLNKRKGDE